MKNLIHKIEHLLKINTGECYSFYKDNKLMMSFKCSKCGKLSGVHEIGAIIDKDIETFRLEKK